MSSALASGFLTSGQPETPPGNILKEELPGFAEGWDVDVRTVEDDLKCCSWRSCKSSSRYGDGGSEGRSGFSLH